MHDTHPCAHCTLNCELHNHPMCVCNLVILTADHDPISTGLRIGLGQVYGTGKLPPCIHGGFGSAYWSVQPEANPAGAPDHRDGRLAPAPRSSASPEPAWACGPPAAILQQETMMAGG